LFLLDILLGLQAEEYVNRLNGRPEENMRIEE